MSEIGNFLHRRRVEQNRSVSELAQASGLSPGTVESIECGSGLWSSVTTYATALGTRVTVRFNASTRDVATIAQRANVSIPTTHAVLNVLRGVALGDVQLASVERVIAAAGATVSFR